MAKINTEFFIARRLSSRQGGPKNVMVRIAAVTVAVSIVVMIIAMAVIFGFKREITSKLTGFSGHVDIVNLDGNSSYQTSPILRNTEVEDAVERLPDFGSIHAYAVKGGVVKTADAMEGVMLKGVEADYDWEFFAGALTEGTLPRIGDTIRTKDIIISRTLAGLLKLAVDDRVEMLFIQSERPPRRDRFRVSGIYHTSLAEMDRVTVVTDIRNVQRLNGWSTEQITGYEVKTTDFGRLDDFSREVYRATFEAELAPGENLMVISVEERYPNLFDWLKAHDVNVAVIITIMLLVALLNMTAAMLIILLERTRMIGELKALGMSNRSLQKVFTIRSGFIILQGLVWGNILGIGLCLVQKYTGLVKLDEAGYFLSEVPIQLGAGWLLALNAGAFLFLVVLLTIPAGVISRISPEKTIRYQ